MTTNILLLSATVTPPPGVPNLVHTDPNLRLVDYERGLRFYLPLVGNGIDHIVLAENSNSDISSLHDLVDQAGLADRVELISFFGLDYPPSHGRGYGEFKLIDYTMVHSTIINTYKSNVVFWKGTGRYIVKNLVDIVKHKPKSFDIYCNFRIGLGKPIHRPLRWMDLYLLAWTSKGYEAVIKKIYKELKEDIFGAPPEILFRARLEQKQDEIKLVPRFKLAPLVDASRGWDGQSFSSGRNLIKFYIRDFVHRFVPGCWI